MGEAWYYNLKTREVEQGKQSRGEDRLGPYPDRETAQHALEIIHQRNDEADSTDQEWKNR